MLRAAIRSLGAERKAQKRKRNGDCSVSGRPESQLQAAAGTRRAHIDWSANRSGKLEIPQSSAANTRSSATSRTGSRFAGSFATRSTRRPCRPRRLPAAVHFSTHLIVAADKCKRRRSEGSEEAHLFALVAQTATTRRADHTAGLHVVLSPFSSANAIMGRSQRRARRQICS